MTTNDQVTAALNFAAKVIELFDDATMKGDYMLDAGECADIIRTLAISPLFTERAATQPAGEVQVIWQYEYLNGDGWHTAYDYDAPTVSDRIRNLVKFTSAAPISEDTAKGFPERDQSKPAEQQGMFHKFDVRRTDGSSAPGGKHHGCRYFVLDLNHDAHAASAMRAYAESCRYSHPQLAADIDKEFPPMPAARTPASVGSEAKGEAADKRDAALDALAAQFSQPYMEYFGSDIQDAIKALKAKG